MTKDQIEDALLWFQNTCIKETELKLFQSEKFNWCKIHLKSCDCWDCDDWSSSAFSTSNSITFWFTISSKYFLSRLKKEKQKIFTLWYKIMQLAFIYLRIFRTCRDCEWHSAKVWSLRRSNRAFHNSFWIVHESNSWNVNSLSF